MRVPGKSWTPEQIELLRKLWAEGETAASIAERLGRVSRSAVMGKIFRLRLRPGDGPEALQVICNIALNEEGEDVAAPVRRRRGGGRKRKPRPLPAAATQHKTLLELTNITCRWIVEATIKWAVARTLSHFQ